jgi:hypothetical protein
MTDLAMDLRPRAAPARSLAIAVSVVAHALAALALFWRLGAAPTYQELPAMNVQLAPLPTSRPPPERSTRTTRPHPARVPPNSVPSNVPPVLVSPAEEPPAPQAAPQPSDSMRNVLRRAAGCEPAALVGLSPAERDACLDRLAKGRGGPSGLNLDRRGDYAAAKNPTPYLTRKPKNGCKATGAGDVAPSGDQGFKAGVGCAWSF